VICAVKGDLNMRHIVIAAALFGALGSASAVAQQPIPLTAYADKNGFIKVQELTCAQLADTYQEDADNLMSWYAGWYAGLAKKNEMQFVRAKVLEHQVITYCKANRGKKIIEAMAVIFKDERIKNGIRLK
jgi:hypothetical protein